MTRFKGNIPDRRLDAFVVLLFASSTFRTVSILLGAVATIAGVDLGSNIASNLGIIAGAR